MTFEEAARRVLEQAGEPLHFREITRRALRHGWLPMTIRTPAAALHAHLAVDILAYGHVSRFQRTPDGAFALRAWGLPEPLMRPRRAKRQPRRVLPPTAGDSLSLPDAIERVLREMPDGGPLAAAEIVTRAQAHGWLDGGRRIPLATVAAAITTDNRRRIEDNQPPRFIAHGEGSYSLAGLGEEHGDVAAHNGLVRRTLLSQIQSLPPSEFAALIQSVLRALGFSRVEVSHISTLGLVQMVGEFLIAGVLRTEVTIHAYPSGERQSAATVKEIRHALAAYGQGLIVSAGDFSLVACAEAARPDAPPVGLISGYDLVTLMASRNIGVHHSPDGRIVPD